eukprot:TRINITY_DN7516_c0_g1_i2.p1 TRINITY_DN7516_c0_g1~~TRINITY_DN7516_c0_g1_i2.p1  ORF type:complete len:1473 (+),score=470.58 TRINITY_DN7516_c0_g1_i2:48-4466(+)
MEADTAGMSEGQLRELVGRLQEQIADLSQELEARTSAARELLRARKATEAELKSARAECERLRWAGGSPELLEQALGALSSVSAAVVAGSRDDQQDGLRAAETALNTAFRAVSRVSVAAADDVHQSPPAAMAAADGALRSALAAVTAAERLVGGAADAAPAHELQRLRDDAAASDAAQRQSEVRMLRMAELHRAELQSLRDEVDVCTKRAAVASEAAARDRELLIEQLEAATARADATEQQVLRGREAAVANAAEKDAELAAERRMGSQALRRALSGLRAAAVRQSAMESEIESLRSSLAEARSSCADSLLDVAATTVGSPNGPSSTALRALTRLTGSLPAATAVAVAASLRRTLTTLRRVPDRSARPAGSPRRLRGSDHARLPADLPFDLDVSPRAPRAVGTMRAALRSLQKLTGGGNDVIWACDGGFGVPPATLRRTLRALQQAAGSLCSPTASARNPADEVTRESLRRALHMLTSARHTAVAPDPGDASAIKSLAAAAGALERASSPLPDGESWSPRRGALAERLQESEAANADLEDDLQDMIARGEVLETQLRGAISRVEQLEGHLTEVRAELRRTSQELHRQKADTAAQRSGELTAEVQRLQAELDSAEAMAVDARTVADPDSGAVWQALADSASTLRRLVPSTLRNLPPAAASATAAVLRHSLRASEQARSKLAAVATARADLEAAAAKRHPEPPGTPLSCDTSSVKVPTEVWTVAEDSVAPSAKDAVGAAMRRCDSLRQRLRAAVHGVEQAKERLSQPQPQPEPPPSTQNAQLPVGTCEVVDDGAAPPAAARAAAATAPVVEACEGHSAAAGILRTSSRRMSAASASTEHTEPLEAASLDAAARGWILRLQRDLSLSCDDADLLLQEAAQIAAAQEDGSATVASLRSKLRDAEGQAARLDGQRSAAEVAAEQLQTVLSQQQQASQLQAESHRKECQDLAQKVGGLREELAEAVRQRERLQQDRSEASQERDRTAAALDELRSRLDTMQTASKMRAMVDGSTSPPLRSRSRPASRQCSRACSPVTSFSLPGSPSRKEQQPADDPRLLAATVRCELLSDELRAEQEAARKSAGAAEDAARTSEELLGRLQAAAGECDSLKERCGKLRRENADLIRTLARERQASRTRITAALRLGASVVPPSPARWLWRWSLGAGVRRRTEVSRLTGLAQGLAVALKSAGADLRSARRQAGAAEALAAARGDAVERLEADLIREKRAPSPQQPPSPRRSPTARAARNSGTPRSRSGSPTDGIRELPSSPARQMPAPSPTRRGSATPGASQAEWLQLPCPPDVPVPPPHCDEYLQVEGPVFLPPPAGGSSPPPTFASSAAQRSAASPRSSRPLDYESMHAGPLPAALAAAAALAPREYEVEVHPQQRRAARHSSPLREVPWRDASARRATSARSSSAEPTVRVRRPPRQATKPASRTGTGSAVRRSETSGATPRMSNGFGPGNVAACRQMSPRRGTAR